MDMDTQPSMTLVMIPASELESIKATQNEILTLLKNPSGKRENIFTSDHVLAADYMKAVGIKRTKFYDLVGKGKIRTLKKCRKIYVPAAEIKRYFTDPSIK
jgi:hypothetical protein